jgi:hypothetical protein
VGYRESGAAMATTVFFRQFGGTFGVAMSGAIMTAKLQGLPTEQWTGHLKGGRAFKEHGIQEIAETPVAQYGIVVGAFRHAISTTFLTGVLITVLAFAIVLYFRSIR